MTADNEDYLALLDNGIDVEADTLEEVTTTYREAVQYTGERLLELFRHLDYHGVLDDSLIIITGDHGYEFGERGFTGAKSLYDANIRQGMIVKPPSDASWTVPNRCDTIDILPTIAQEIDADVPDQCQGQPWQSKEDDSSQPRITERIRQKHYNVAVEIDGIKAIYTYYSDPPTRPTSNQLADGPLREEYYDLSAVRDERFEDCGDSLNEETKAQFRSTADEFVSSSMRASDSRERTLRQPTQETEKQLRQLGYK
jgi:arylsulfatase A-like enzyme